MSDELPFPEISFRGSLTVVPTRKLCMCGGLKLVLPTSPSPDAWF